MTQTEQPDFGYFHDGKGPKSKDTPDEFGSDWQYHDHIASLENEVAGAERRLLELDGMGDVPAVTRAGAESALEAAQAELARYAGKPKKGKK